MNLSNLNTITKLVLAMRLLSLLILYVVNCNIKGYEEEKEVERDNVLEKLLRTGTIIYPDYQLVTRQLATEIYVFKSYKSVSLIFYPITNQVTEARFTFQSKEIHLNKVGSCSPNEVIINLKYGAYPAVNPDGYDFPKDFIESSQREPVHSIELRSDGTNISYVIDNPRPGFWYSLVYIKWEDPKKEQIVQQGLDAECQTILYSDLQVKLEENIIQIDCYEDKTLEFEVIPALFKCMSLASGEAISLRLKNTEYKKLYIGVDALSLPTEQHNIVYCSLEMKDSIQVITFIPHSAVWHYIELGNIEGNISRLPNCETSIVRSDLDVFNNHTIIQLMRIDKGSFFSFDYSLPSNDVYDEVSLINISSSETKSLGFKINEFVDIGGTLLISASVLMNLRYYMGYSKDLDEQSLLAVNHKNQLVKIVICMDMGHPSIPLESGRCRYNDKLKPALFVLSNVDPGSIYEKTYIPFPESGTWYLTLRIFCDLAATYFKVFQNGSVDYVDTANDMENSSASSEGNYSSTYEGTSLSECSATVVLHVSSMSCVDSRCSSHGDCRLHAYGGLVMSFCSCHDGYGSWDCSDSTRMVSRSYMLMSVYLLTLSNLMFLLSIYVAVIRLYYTEATIYTLTLLFSTFYHACDASPQVRYCIFRGNVLQFGDFYSAANSFWFTLIAMCILSDELRSFFQIIGVIFTALLMSWDRFSFISFTTPAIVGVIILLISWYLDYRKTKRVRYVKSYYVVYLPIGLILLFSGFMCFAFLQTNQNYMIVHSIWHMVVALSIVVLLPDVRRETEANPFTPSPTTAKMIDPKSIRKFFSKNQGNAEARSGEHGGVAGTPST